MECGNIRGTRLVADRAEAPPVLSSINNIVCERAERLSANPLTGATILQLLSGGRLSLLKNSQIVLVDLIPAAADFFTQLALSIVAVPIPFPLEIPVNIERELQRCHDCELLAQNTAKDMCDFLVLHREMLNEYFAISISPAGLVSTMPVLLEDHAPAVAAVGQFLYDLCTVVDWEREEQCLGQICSALGRTYAESITERNSNFVTLRLVPAMAATYRPAVPFPVETICSVAAANTALPQITLRRTAVVNPFA